MAKPKIGVIVGSTREVRFGGDPAHWIAERAKASGEFEVELLDLRDYPMPFFDEQSSPAYVPSKDETAQKWQKKIASLDGFVIVTAEYNRGPAAVLKNALDYAYTEWNRKPVAFVGYGGVGGARAVEQLRLNAIELQMAPVRAGVHILWPDYMAVKSGDKTLAELDHLNKGADDMIDQLAWWVRALNAARKADIEQAEAA
jgi:NAD(P)H-dependent FMN reductase